MTLVRTVGDVTRDPIVVVGMGCRFPGGITSADELQQAVIDDQDLVSESPVDRGQSQNGWCGGFLDDTAEFDAGFFGISPREALAMDPQPRVLLEVIWEAMEHARIDPTSLLREPVGVYVGTIGQESGIRCRTRDHLARRRPGDRRP